MTPTILIYERPDAEAVKARMTEWWEAESAKRNRPKRPPHRVESES